MSNADKVTGRVKQSLGDLTGDDDLKRNGQTQETAGKVKDAAETAKDKVEDAVDKVKDKLTKD
jgi:uncharacterized protein YjbJ (UPF0337 family)